jgi:hypothetical protein
VNTSRRFPTRLKWANHSPKVEKRSELDLVEATTSHTRGRRKYAAHAIRAIVSTLLR